MAPKDHAAEDQRPGCGRSPETRDSGSSSPTRRQLLQAGAASLLVPGVSRAAEEGPLRFRLEEPGGLRRFGYPVRVALPGVHKDANFALTREGRAVSAQFRAVPGSDGKVVLDFNASPGPLESQEYEVRPVAASARRPGPKQAEFAIAGKAGRPGPRQGMRVESSDGGFRVSNGSLLSFSVPENLAGFLSGVKSAQCDFVVPEKSAGLWIRGKGGETTRISGDADKGRKASATIERDGPLAIGLGFERTDGVGANQTVNSALAMTFPSSKSWIELSWRIDDPMGTVAGMGLDVHLRLGAGTTLVDFGANSTVYGQLKDQEHMELVAGRAQGSLAGGRPWSVRQGTGNALAPFAEAPSRDSPPAEGWAHVMDNHCCTAAAVADFGRASRDSIDVDASGWLRIRRDFALAGSAPTAGPKNLQLWLHFVPMPVQIGAATSPQAMLAPLRVVWL